MSTQQQAKLLPPAQLLVGPHAGLVTHTKTLLKTLLCTNNGCTTCITCLQVENNQHHAAIWFEPEKQYTLDKLDPIFKSITFALNADQRIFFIIQKAEFLTPACSNKLLKSVEEPPPGYHFIFLTERVQSILPTIRSRCIMHSIYTAVKSANEELTDIFKKKLTCAPSVFLKMLAQKNPNERETIEYLDELFAHWLKKHKTALMKKNNTQECTVTARMIALLKNALNNPPMPGSSKLFWKNFYLQVKNR